MSIEPEVIPPHSSAGFNAIRSIPSWVIYGVIFLGVLLLVGILKTILPLLVMGLVIGFIWKQAKRN